MTEQPLRTRRSWWIAHWWLPWIVVVVILPVLGFLVGTWIHKACA